ncbi:hypothetical protein EDB83DRAFT_2318442 [Lactarius deliciosus]|nr:hypothetical protein EDB83DRAFT_2318442 [Lactarius deliciosus]
MLFNLLFDPAFLRCRELRFNWGGTKKTPPSVIWEWEEDDGDEVPPLETPAKGRVGGEGAREEGKTRSEDIVMGCCSIFQWLLTVRVLPQATKKNTFNHHCRLYNLSTAPVRWSSRSQACVVRHGAEFEPQTVATEGSAGLARTPNDGGGGDGPRRRLRTSTSPPHLCCPLLRAPSTTTTKGDPAVASLNHAAQRRQQRPL